MFAQFGDGFQPMTQFKLCFTAPVGMHGVGAPVTKRATKTTTRLTSRLRQNSSEESNRIVRRSLPEGVPRGIFVIFWVSQGVGVLGGLAITRLWTFPKAWR
jgi:hypothetical protein